MISSASFTCFTVIALFAGAVTATPCVVGDMTYRGMSVPLVQVDNSRQISGTFEVIDGCSFRIRGFTLSPPALATYFYGAKSPKSTENQFRIHGAQLGGFVQVDRVFNLTSSDNTGDFSQMYSWSEFNTVKIYSENDGTTLAYAQLGKNLDPEESAAGISNTQSLPFYFFVAMMISTLLLTQ